VVRGLQPLFMHSDDHPAVSIRPMAPADRAAVADIIVSVGNFNCAEIDCALELVDIYLGSEEQRDYCIVVAESTDARITGYACWGPIPLTVGGYDLYWIATHPAFHGQGSGRALMSYVEERVQQEGGRLLVLETSSKESYGNTVRFYRRRNYEEVSRIRDFYDVGDDKFVFVKRFCL
jgi:ribosomal protein S18 acetylase RimI-like enzyme